MAVSNIFGIAGSALTAQSARMNVSASNLANANSSAGPDGKPYRAKEVQFRLDDTDGSGIGGVSVSGMTHDNSPFKKQYEPDNPLADDKGYVQMPNVNPTEEMVNMMSASRSYQADIEVLNTGKDLALRTLTLGQ